ADDALPLPSGFRVCRLIGPSTGPTTLERPLHDRNALDPLGAGRRRHGPVPPPGLETQHRRLALRLSSPGLARAGAAWCDETRAVLLRRPLRADVGFAGLRH